MLASAMRENKPSPISPSYQHLQLCIRNFGLQNLFRSVILLSYLRRNSKRRVELVSCFLHFKFFPKRLTWVISESFRTFQCTKKKTEQKFKSGKINWNQKKLRAYTMDCRSVKTYEYLTIYTNLYSL